MSKTGGSYNSVVLGVSEQVAQNRRPGQHTEQINMISDPVHGLARRHGSVWQSEVALGARSLAPIQADGMTMREYTFNIEGVEYCAIYRPNASAQNSDTFLHMYRKDTGTFLPVVYESSTVVNNLVSGGCSAIANVGSYLYMAGNAITPAASTADNWNASTNKSKFAVWIRAGAYSRTFSVTLTRNDDTQLTVSYKTPSSAYPELNDTSGIDFYESDGTTPRPDYQKDINDANNLYNSNVTKWISTASEAITGEAIAQSLADLLVAAGVGTATVVNTTITIDDTNFKEIEADDGGDGQLVRAVGMTLASQEGVSLVHYIGKVIRIQPRGSSDAEVYYLRADSKVDGATGWGEVIWRETVGVSSVPTTMFAQGLLHDGTFYIAQNGAGLQTLSGVDSPDYKERIVGDDLSAPVPKFFGSKITMLGVFQDRLVVGSGGTVNMSRPGDYLNFFRHTVMNVQTDDPIEMYTYAGEGDTLRWTTTFDKDLVIFGDQKQYTVNGQTVLSAVDPNMTVLSSIRDSSTSGPVASGSFVFFGSVRAGRTSMSQLQVGQLANTPASYEITQALDKYIRGNPVQIIAFTAPNILFYRTTSSEREFFVYSYLDDAAGGQRLFDSWSRWQYAAELGTVCGMSSYKGQVVLFSYRGSDSGVYLVADLQSLDSDISDKPYADSLKPYSDIEEGDWHSTMVASTSLVAAADNTSEYFLLGSRYPQVASLITQLPGIESALQCGVYADALVTPTNPYVRDQNGKAITSGRLTIGQVRPTVVKTGACLGIVETTDSSVDTLVFEGRLLSRASNLIGRQPLYTGQLAMGVGRNNEECSYTLQSEDWQPLTITAIRWTGQNFDRVRR